MDNRTLPWAAAAMGVTVVCFCIGYFFLGGKGSPGESGPMALATPGVTATPPTLAVAPGRDHNIAVEETTGAKEAARIAAEKKRQDELKRIADEQARLAAQPSPDSDPTPDPATTPDPDSAGPNDPGPTPSPEPTAKPAEPKPTPSPTPRPDEPKPSSETLYHVQLSASYASKDDADTKAAELRGSGFPASVQPGGKGWVVQTGAYSDKKAADKKAKELQANGYDVAVRSR